MNVYFKTTSTPFKDEYGPSLVSIGLIAESGPAFYAELTDYNGKYVNRTVEKEVINQLTERKFIDDIRRGLQKRKTAIVEKACDAHKYHKVVGNSEQVRDSLREWFVELYRSEGYFSSTATPRTPLDDRTHLNNILLIGVDPNIDMYLLCKLFKGTLPQYVTPYSYNIKQDICPRKEFNGIIAASLYSEEGLMNLLWYPDEDYMDDIMRCSVDDISSFMHYKFTDSPLALRYAELIKYVYEYMRRK